MVERLRQLFENLPEQLRNLPPSRLFALLGVIGAVLAIAVVSLLWMSKGDSQGVLYTHLTLEDAAAVTAKLKEMQIPYTIQGDGTTILVAAPAVYETRLRLATEGLPQGGGVGFELFDQHSFGMTEFVQKLNYRRALQGELARTIMQLAAVQHARVHIVLPEKSLFIDHQDKPTASVVLKLSAGRRLARAQVDGITRLVASSVEGLQPDDVTVVDTGGQILSRREENTSFLSQTEAQLSYQQTFQQNLERRVQSLLERAIGKGKVLVRVSAALDFQRIERTEERFDADNPAIRSEQRNKEEGTGTALRPVGVPGVRSNVATSDVVNTQNQDQSSMTRQSETINYELSKMVSKVVAPSGEVKRLSVAVLVDGAYQPGDKDGVQKYTPRTPEELAQYVDIVKSAVGFSEARGDRVDVANIPFDSQPDVEVLQMTKEADRAFWLNVGRYGVYVILGILFLLFVGRPLVKSITQMGDRMPAETELPRTVEELEAHMGVSGMLPEPDNERHLDLKARPSGQEMRTQLAEFVRSEPERAVEVLRVWLRS